MKKRWIIWLVVLLVLPNLASAHEDEYGDSDNFHFFHMGKLTFPVWTYWGEIVEHFLMVIVFSAGLFYIYTKKKVDKIGSMVVSGFVLILISELFTLLHHFLIFPLGVLNAVFGHGLLLVGMLLVVFGIIKGTGEKK